MFDVTKNQEIYEQFLQCFKQLHTETVTSFYIKYQTQTHRLITRGIWSEDDSNKFNELSFFKPSQSLISPNSYPYFYNSIQFKTQKSTLTKFTNMH